MSDTLRIVVDDGRRRVPIVNMDGEEIGAFYFSPTDVGIYERVNKMKDDFDKIVEPLENIDKINEDGTTDDEDESKINALKEAEERLYSALNGVFNADVCSAFFRDVNPFSPIEGGFYCMRVIEAVTQFVNDAFEKENKKRSDNIEKYTKRFKKK